MPASSSSSEVTASAEDPGPGAAGAPTPRTPDPAAEYGRREAEHRMGVEDARRTSERLVRARTATFLLGVAGLVLWDFLGRPFTPLALLAAALLAAGFSILVGLHRRARAAEARHGTFLALNQEGLHRLARRWDQLPPGPGPGDDEVDGHPFAGDLQLFGRVSLAALAGPVSTAPGQRILSSWLLEPAPPAEVRSRQEAVRELAGALDRRLELAALGRRDGPPSLARTGALLSWAEAPPWLLATAWVRAASWLLPGLFWGLVLLHLAGYAGPLWALPLLLQLLLLRRYGGRIRQDFAAAAATATEIARYAGQIRLVRGWSAKAPRLAACLEALRGPDDPADERLRSLARWIDFAESRSNPIYKLAALLLLLDFHVHRGLERWKAASGGRLRGWMEALGEVEALAALSCVAHDNPGWSFPELHDEPRLVGRRLGHPLIHPERCVGNDVEVGPPGTFLFVTGSNMSGKSTLLRALGSNVVLASAGAPVCAAALSLPALTLHTSIRVQDSLEEGVSLFMAELLALARTVTAAREAEAGGRRVLYLVDEMLQGTNSAERRVAARTILRQLLGSGAIGAVTTHDLSLTAARDLEATAVAVHFRETATVEDGRPRLHFDYRLYPGLATTRNALKLLEMVGLGTAAVEGEPDASGSAGLRDA